MLDGVPQLPEHYVEPNGLEALAARVATGNLTAVSGLQGERGTGKSVLAAAVAHRTGTANVPPYLTDKNVVGALPLKTPAGMPRLSRVS